MRIASASTLYLACDASATAASAAACAACAADADAADAAANSSDVGVGGSNARGEGRA